MADAKTLWDNGRMPWFTTKGQICQLLVTTCLPLCIAGYNARPDMMESKFFTGGAILFYVLVLIVVGSVLHLIAAIRKRDRSSADGVGASPDTLMPSHGIIGDFVDVTIEKADYGSGQYRKPALVGLPALLASSESLRPDGAISIGVT